MFGILGKYYVTVFEQPDSRNIPVLMPKQQLLAGSILKERLKLFRAEHRDELKVQHYATWYAKKDL